jgi:hypothetical protein
MDKMRWEPSSAQKSCCEVARFAVNCAKPFDWWKALLQHAGEAALRSEILAGRVNYDSIWISPCRALFM